MVFRGVMKTKSGLGGLILSFGVSAIASAAPTTRPIDFNRDIRPILSNSCYACHGPDSNKRKGDPPLRLDTKSGLFGERDAAFPIAAGKLDESQVFYRISSDDPDVHMPPRKSNRPQPTTQQIATIKAWIEQGAPWKDHWAYIPATRPAVPTIAASIAPASAIQNDIDRFILEALAEHGLKPAQQ